MNAGSTTSSSSKFQLLSGCTCPGSNTTYECAVIGDGFTLFNGTAFDCTESDNQITLPHTNYETGTGTKHCNTFITARSLEISSNSYISQLTVNVSQELNGRSVNCSYHSSSGATFMVGLLQIEITKGIKFYLTLVYNL